MWVAALRSGEYRQGAGLLHSPDTGTYCCLGVACDLAVKHGVIKSYDGYEAVLGGTARPVVQWLGLSDDSAGYDGGRGQLTYDNDVGKTFAEIADIIESNPPGLFR